MSPATPPTAPPMIAPVCDDDLIKDGSIRNRDEMGCAYLGRAGSEDGAGGLGDEAGGFGDEAGGFGDGAGAGAAKVRT